MDTTATVREEWNYGTVILALVGAVVLHVTFGACLCYGGTITMYLGGALDLLVVVRLIIARARRERGRGWVLYAILPYLVAPLFFVMLLL